MLTTDLAARLGAKRTSAGWMTQCPAHSDRRPSLSIRGGKDGRTLIRCFAGCEPSAIVQALGLELSDLFEDAPARATRCAPRHASADDVERELQSELTRIVALDSELCGFEVAELARHRNEARAIIERRFDVSLKREIAPWWEIDPYSVDRAWKVCVEQALRVTAAEANQRFGTVVRAIVDMPETQDRVLRLARSYQRELVPTTQSGAAA